MLLNISIVYSREEQPVRFYKQSMINKKVITYNSLFQKLTKTIYGDDERFITSATLGQQAITVPTINIIFYIYGTMLIII